jgi:2-polyprenyl-3-methyl-5-hydroxy-6-metoxy-1,4-benzoquinol methylase
VSNNCPVCKSPNNIAVVQYPIDCEYGIVRTQAAIINKCADCSCYYQSPMPTVEELASFYHSDYQNYVTTRNPGLAKINKLYQELLARGFEKTYGRNVSILDFGCGQGAFLKCLSKGGFEKLVGFDFVEYDETDDMKGVRFIWSLSELQQLRGKLDVIRMNHVIEHLVGHDELMPLLTSLLKPGGVVIGETPNPAHYTARLWGRFWGPLHFPYHTVLFSPHSLRKACPSWGLYFESSTGTIVPTGWALSFENLAKMRSGLTHRGRTKLYVLYMLIFSPLALLDKIVSWRMTANFKFLLRKLN